MGNSVLHVCDAEIGYSGNRIVGDPLTARARISEVSNLFEF
jgi:hypothetical protein